VTGNWKVIQIYSKVSDVSTWESFKKICKRDGISMSDRLLELCVRSYVAQHVDGNSQAKLDYAGLPSTLPLYQTCNHSRHEEDGRVMLVKSEFLCLRDHHYKIAEACGRCEFYREMK